MDMCVIEIVGTRFGARAAVKAFRMLLVLWEERGVPRVSPSPDC
jgi:hypothetical protein